MCAFRKRVNKERMTNSAISQFHSNKKMCRHYTLSNVVQCKVTFLSDTGLAFKVYNQLKYHRNAHWCRPYERCYRPETIPSRKEQTFLSLFATERTIRVMLTCGLVAPTHKDVRVPNLRQEQLGHDTQKKIMITQSVLQRPRSDVRPCNKCDKLVRECKRQIKYVQHFTPIQVRSPHRNHSTSTDMC